MKRHPLQRMMLESGLIRPNAHLCVGISGGADSVALAWLLHDLPKNWGLKWELAHLNHRLRGKEADGDEGFVRALAARLDVPVHVTRADVRGRARRSGQSIEMAARAARHDFFKKLVRRHTFDAVVLAHNLDDQAETVLLRLLRGTGGTGIGGIRADTVVGGVRIIRPLLGASHRDLTQYLIDRDETWREDASNEDDQFQRNRMRNELIPLLAERFNPRIRESLARTAGVLQDEDEYLAACAACRLSERCMPKDPAALALAGWTEEAVALQRRMIQEWLKGQGMDASLLHGEAIERVLRLAAGRGRIATLPGGWRVRRRAEALHVDRAEELAVRPFKTRVRVPGQTVMVEQGIRIETEWGPGIHRPPRRACGLLPAAASLSGEALGRAALWVRSWRPGDRMAPLGMKGTRKVQDIFVDEKVPQERRATLPLLVCRNEVIWIPGYAIARDWAVLSETKRILQVRIGQI